MHWAEGKVETKTNHNGGILGGISGGSPVIFRLAIKPTASIGKPQLTVNLAERKDTLLTIGCRHDPCIIPLVTGDWGTTVPLESSFRAKREIFLADR